MVKQVFTPQFSLPSVNASALVNRRRASSKLSTPKAPRKEPETP